MSELSILSCYNDLQQHTLEYIMASDIEKLPVSLRVPMDICAAFDRVASVLERDRTWVMLRAFRQYLEGEGADVLAEAEGLAALDRGEGVDFDTAMDAVDAAIDRAERKNAATKAG